jgi:hypothetical protein
VFRFQRRWLRISLRTLLVLFTLLCLYLGYLANSAHQQRHTLEGIRKLNKGAINYDRQLEDLWVPAWLCHAIGDDYFLNVTEVHLSDDTTTENLPEIIGFLQRLPNLKMVYLWHSRVTDDDFRHFTKLKQISHLGFEFPHGGIDGTGLRHLTSMDNIRELSLRSSRIRNDALQYLPKFRSLKVLRIGGDFNDEGLQILPECQELEVLHLMASYCSGPGLKSIVAIKNLKQLMLWRMQIQGANPDLDVESSIATGYILLSPSGITSGIDLAQASCLGRLKGWLEASRPGLTVWWAY